MPGLGIADAGDHPGVERRARRTASATADTLNDIVVGADCRSTQLRVERSGAGNGRVYTITLHVQDLAGNRTEATVKVLVPTTTCTDDTAVDDGPQFTVPSTCP